MAIDVPDGCMVEIVVTPRVNESSAIDASFDALYMMNLPICVLLNKQHLLVYGNAVLVYIVDRRFTKEKRSLLPYVISSWHK